jgi:hypothetical protein
VLEKCNASIHYPQYEEFINVKSGLNFPGMTTYCMNPYKAVSANGTVFEKKLTFKNNYSSVNSKWINYLFKFCDPKTDASCDKKKIDKYKEVFYVNIYYLSYIVDYANNQNPFTLILQNQLVYLSYGARKKFNLNIANTYINTDNGILFEDVSTLRAFSYAYSERDVGFSESEFLILTLSSPNFINIATRSYLKIQTVIANVGGVIKIFMLISALIMKIPSKSLLYSAFINSRLYASKNNHQESDSIAKLINFMPKSVPKKSQPKKTREILSINLYTYIKSLLCKKKFKQENQFLSFAKSVLEYETIANSIVDIFSIKCLLIEQNQGNMNKINRRIDVNEYEKHLKVEIIERPERLDLSKD